MKQFVLNHNFWGGEFLSCKLRYFPFPTPWFCIWLEPIRTVESFDNGLALWFSYLSATSMWIGHIPHVGLSPLPQVRVVSQRFPETTPLVFRGPGAGAEFTASGLFAPWRAKRGGWFARKFSNKTDRRSKVNQLYPPRKLTWNLKMMVSNRI